MDVFIHRSPIGVETFDLEDIQELEEQLKGFDTFKPLSDKEEVTVESKGSWGEIQELLSHSCFQNIWFDPKRSTQ